MALRDRRTLFSALLVALGAIAAYFIFSTGAPQRIVGLFSARGIVPGFVGVADFGEWRLICAPGPALPLLPASELATAPAGNTACRVNQEVSSGSDPAVIVLAANLSLVGPMRKPALMLRLPANFKENDPIVLGFDDRDVVTTAIRQCSETECMAASALSDGEWQRLTRATTLRITMPTAGGPLVYIRLPVEGLAAATAAMARAQEPAD